MEKPLRSSCLTDDDIACLSVGLLNEAERAAAEQHLDVCPACSRMVVDLGRAFGQASLTESDFVLMKESDAWHRTSGGWEQLPAMAKLQLSQAAVLIAACFLIEMTERFPVVRQWVLLWGGALAGWSLVNSVGFAQSRRWAVPSAKVASVFALLSGITLAHSVYTWYLLSRHSSR